MKLQCEYKSGFLQGQPHIRAVNCKIGLITVLNELLVVFIV